MLALKFAIRFDRPEPALKRIGHMSLNFGAITKFYVIIGQIDPHHLTASRPGAAVSRVGLIGREDAFGDLLFVLEYPFFAVDLARHGGDIAVHFSELFGILGTFFAPFA